VEGRFGDNRTTGAIRINVASRVLTSSVPTIGVEKLERIQNVDRCRVMENIFLARPTGSTAQITRENNAKILYLVGTSFNRSSTVSGILF